MNKEAPGQCTAVKSASVSSSRRLVPPRLNSQIPETDAAQVPPARTPSIGDPIRKQIEAILGGLPVLHEQQWLIFFIAEELLLRRRILTENGNKGEALPMFRHASTATVRKQLTELRSRTASLAEKIERGGRSVRAREQLAKLVDSLSATSISALGDVPPMVWDGRYSMADISQLTTGALSARLLGREHPHVSATELRFWSVVAAKSEGAKGKNTGRPLNMQVHNIAQLVTSAYIRLTGKEPKFSSTTMKTTSRKVAYAGSRQRINAQKRTYAGSFHHFAQDIFDALDIPTDAMYYIAPAAFEQRGKGRRR